jgi:dephospho-CoA kinase
MQIIGITGGTGAGKTTVLSVLEEFGALTIDCDAVYHELLENNARMKREIESAFPGTLRDGEIDRKALGAVVFNDSEALEILNDITHKFVNSEINKRMADWRTKGGSIVAVDAIALIEGGFGEKCDFIVGVTAPAEIRAKRIMEREGISYEYAMSRISAQRPDGYFYANCEYMLVNDCDTADEFREKCREFFKDTLEVTH